MNTNLISLKYQYFSQLRKPVREEVLKLMEGADIDSVSSDAVLAYRIINHFEQEAAAAAASAPAAAASNVAESKSVANNQQPVEPHKASHVATAAAQPDGPANDAAVDADVVDADVVDADDADEANEVVDNAANDAEVDAAGEVNAAVDEVAEVGRPSCMPRQATVGESVSMEGESVPVAAGEQPVDGCEPNACEAEPEWAEPMAAVRCEGRPEVWKSSFACDYVCRFAENFVTLRYGNECN